MKKICTVNAALAWILFGFGLYLVVWRTLGPHLQRMPGEPCDSRFSSLILEHGYLFLLGKVPSYFSASFLYPIQNVITFSDNFLATLPLYAGLRLASFDRETAYQLWFAALFALNYWICLYAVKKMGVTSPAACLAAYVFAFSLPVLQEVAHPAMLHLFMVPLAYCYAVLFFAEHKPKYIYLTALALVIQFYASFYVTALLGLGLGIFILLQSVRERAFVRDFIFSRKVVHIPAAILVMAGLVAPLAVPYFHSAALYGFQRFPETVIDQLPKMVYYCSASSLSLLWSWTSGLAAQSAINTNMFVGALPLLSFFAFPFLARNRPYLHRFGITLFLDVVVLVLLTVNLGPNSPYTFLMLVPPFQSLRALTRIVAVLVFPLAVLLALAIETLHEKIGRHGKRYATLFFLVATAAVVLDQAHGPVTGYSKAGYQKAVWELEDRLRANGRGFTVFASIPREGDARYNCVLQVNAMLAAQDLGVATVNAYTSWFPPGYDLFADCTVDSLQQWIYWSALYCGHGGCVGTFDDLLVLSDAAGPVPRLDTASRGLRGRLIARYAADPVARAGLLRFILDMWGFYEVPGGPPWMGATGEMATAAGEQVVFAAVSPMAMRCSLYRNGALERVVPMPAFTPREFRLGGATPARYRFVADRVDTGSGLDPRPRHFPVSLRLESLSFTPAAPTP